MCLNWNLKTKLFNILRRKSLILKLGQLFEKYIRKIFKEKYTDIKQCNIKQFQTTIYICKDQEIQPIYSKNSFGNKKYFERQKSEILKNCYEKQKIAWNYLLVPFQVVNYVHKFLSLATHRLTIFNTLIQQGF